MFNERDWVIHPKSGNRGQVLEIADGIAYIELENGVEMDYSVADLMLESDYKTPQEREREIMDLKSDAHKQLAGVIWPKIRPVLANMTQRYAENAGAAVVALGGTAGGWDTLTAYHKMNFLCVWTGTTFDQWVDAAEVGKLAHVQLTILATIGEELSK